MASVCYAGDSPFRVVEYDNTPYTQLKLNGLTARQLREISGSNIEDILNVISDALPVVIESEVNKCLASNMEKKSSKDFTQLDELYSCLEIESEFLKRYYYTNLELFSEAVLSLHGENIRDGYIAEYKNDATRQYVFRIYFEREIVGKLREMIGLDSVRIEFFKKSIDKRKAKSDLLPNIVFLEVLIGK